MATPDISTLIQQLQDGPNRVRAEAAARLETQGEAAVPALLEMLGNDNPQIRHRAVWALEEIDTPEAAPGLVGRLYDAHPKVRLAAVFALGRLATRHRSAAGRAVLGLRDSLLDAEPVIRQKAAQALGEIGRAWPKAGDRALWGLIEALRDESALVRATAAGSLGAIGDSRACSALLGRLDDEQAMVRLACLDGLAAVKDISVLPELRKQMADSPSRAERLAYIEAIEAIGGVRVALSVRAAESTRNLRSSGHQCFAHIQPLLRPSPKPWPKVKPSRSKIVWLAAKKRRIRRSTPRFLAKVYLIGLSIIIIVSLLTRHAPPNGRFHYTDFCHMEADRLVCDTR